MQRGLSSISQQGLLGRSKCGKDTSFPGSRSCELPENTEIKYTNAKLSHCIP